MARLGEHHEANTCVLTATVHRAGEVVDKQEASLRTVWGEPGTRYARFKRVAMKPLAVDQTNKKRRTSASRLDDAGQWNRNRDEIWKALKRVRRSEAPAPNTKWIDAIERCWALIHYVPDHGTVVLKRFVARAAVMMEHGVRVHDTWILPRVDEAELHLKTDAALRKEKGGRQLCMPATANRLQRIFMELEAIGEATFRTWWDQTASRAAEAKAHRTRATAFV